MPQKTEHLRVSGSLNEHPLPKAAGASLLFLALKQSVPEPCPPWAARTRETVSAERPAQCLHTHHTEVNQDQFQSIPWAEHVTITKTKTGLLTGMSNSLVDPRAESARAFVRRKLNGPEASSSGAKCLKVTTVPPERQTCSGFCVVQVSPAPVSGWE